MHRRKRRRLNKRTPVSSRENDESKTRDDTTMMSAESIDDFVSSYIAERTKEQRALEDVDGRMAKCLADVRFNEEQKERSRVERAEAEHWKVQCLRELASAHFPAELYRRMDMQTLLSHTNTLFKDEYGHSCTAKKCTMKHFEKNQVFVNVHNRGEVLKASGDVWFCKESGIVHLCGKGRCKKGVVAPKGEGVICQISGLYMHAVIRQDTFIDPSNISRGDHNMLHNKHNGSGGIQKRNKMYAKRRWKRELDSAMMMRNTTDEDHDYLDEDATLDYDHGDTYATEELDDDEAELYIGGGGGGGGGSGGGGNGMDGGMGDVYVQAMTPRYGKGSSGIDPTIQSFYSNTDYSVKTIPQSVATAGALTSKIGTTSVRAAIDSSMPGTVMMTPAVTVSSAMGQPISYLAVGTPSATSMANTQEQDEFDSFLLAGVNQISTAADRNSAMMYTANGLVSPGSSGVLGKRKRHKNYAVGGGKLSNTAANTTHFPSPSSRATAAAATTNRLHILDAGVDGGTVNRRVLYDKKYAKRVQDRSAKGGDGILSNLRSVDIKTIERIAKELIFPRNRDDIMEAWLGGKERDADKAVKKLYEEHTPKLPPWREVVRVHANVTLPTYREWFTTVWAEKENPKALRYFINCLSALWNIIRSTPYANRISPAIQPCITALLYALRDGFEVDVKLFGDQTMCLYEGGPLPSPSSPPSPKGDAKRFQIVRVVFIPAHAYLRKQLVPHKRAKRNASNVSFMNGHKTIRTCFTSVIKSMENQNISKLKPFLLEEHVHIEDIE